MTTLTPTPKQQFLDANGNPLSGGKVYTYAAGTTTPLVTYTDESGTVPNTNPVILDSRGEAAIWLGVASYKLKLTTSTDVEIWTVDNIVSASVQALADLSESGGSALVGFIQTGTGATATTVQARLRETISVKDFGAVGDGTTDDKAAVQAAIDACSNKTLVFPPGTYLISGATGLTISNPIYIKFDGNAKLLFNNNNATYIQTVANNVSIENIWIDGGSTSWTRTGNAAIRVKDNGAATYNIRFIKPRIENVAGGGILVGWTNTIYNVTIENPVVQYTQADGVSIVYDVQNVTITNPKCYNTGDDGVSIVSYSSAASPIKNVTVTDALSVNSATRGLTVIGGQDIKVSGRVINSAVQGVLVLQDTGGYATVPPVRVELDVQVYNSTGTGVEIGRNATDITGNISVVGAKGTRGVLIGSGAGTEVVRANFGYISAASCTGTGVEINGAQQVSVGSINVSSNGTYGLVLATPGKNIVIGSVVAYNNNTTSVAGVDNILCNTVTGFNFGSVFSIDDNSSPKIERTLDVSACTNGLIGSFFGVKNTTITAPNIQSSCVNVGIIGGVGVGQYGCVGTVTAKPTASHFPNGTWALDTSNNKIYFHVGSGTWKEAALT
jgi:hypothetical protein